MLRVVACLTLASLIGCASQSRTSQTAIGAAATAAIVESSAREGFLPVPGGRVFYRMLGAGKPGIPLLAAHGGPGGTSCRFEVLAPLADERPVIFYDQLGSGRSDRPADTTLWRFPRFVEEMDAVRRGLNLTRVHLMGTSWGGALVAEYMLSAPRTGVQSLILGSPLLSTPRWIADANLLRAALPASVRAALDRNEAAGTYDTPEYKAATDSFYARHVRRLPVAPVAACANVTGNNAIYRQMWGPTEFTSTGSLKTWDREAWLPKLALPVLFVAGQYDEARPETLELFRRTMPDARLVVIPGAAHAALGEKPTEYVAAVRGFLREVERRR
ncbi:MAG: proline iminopeptidase-family hydrolase [Gemmatimonadaceae bacterium]|jgi:proline iminopeptidase|nr:proline iminopeptidase-family hydrolase [Gemmatimonadaceae bacterium]